jgi:hypothetical protein
VVTNPDPGRGAGSAGPPAFDERPADSPFEELAEENPFGHR